MRFPDGEISRGHKTIDTLESEFATILQSVNFNGKTVLDIGAWDGFFSFSAEKAGAKSVLANDYYCWISEGMGSKNNFNVAKKKFDSRVNELLAKPEDIPLIPGSFDIVLLLGVTYHVRNPISLLNRCAILAKEQVIVETEFRDDGHSEPILYLILGDELAGDPTNWNVPNRSGAIGMMQAAGFRDVKAIPHPTLPSSRLFLSGIPTATSIEP
jgi:tRNA (mo5U34)-methyltransferase